MRAVQSGAGVPGAPLRVGSAAVGRGLRPCQLSSAGVRGPYPAQAPMSLLLQRGGHPRPDSVVWFGSSFQGGMRTGSSLSPQHPAQDQGHGAWRVLKDSSPRPGAGGGGCWVPHLTQGPGWRGWGGSCQGGLGDGDVLPLLFSVLGHGKA